MLSVVKPRMRTSYKNRSFSSPTSSNLKFFQVVARTRNFTLWKHHQNHMKSWFLGFANASLNLILATSKLKIVYSENRTLESYFCISSMSCWVFLSRCSYLKIFWKSCVIHWLSDKWSSWTLIYLLLKSVFFTLWIYM